MFVAHAVDIRAMSVVGTIPDGAFLIPPNYNLFGFTFLTLLDARISTACATGTKIRQAKNASETEEASLIFCYIGVPNTDAAETVWLPHMK